MRGTRRIIFVSHSCYLDSSNGANIASRSMMECLARRGFAVAAVTGTVLESGREVDPGIWLSEQGLTFEFEGGPVTSGHNFDPSGCVPISYQLNVQGVDVVLHRGPTTRPHEPDESEIEGFLGLLDEKTRRFRADVMVTFGGDVLATRIRHLARSRGIAVVFALHNFNYASPAPFADTDAIIVPSRFAASYYRRMLRLECHVLPNLIDFDRVRAVSHDPRYVTFVNPSYEKGVYVFAKIADELARRRPDIPLLVVEARGTERTLVDCGLDLRPHGNVHLMSHTPDPRHFWTVTRICLLPSLWWENQPAIAYEAMINGIPVIGSDRGGIPETLGDSGIVLALPPGLTPSTRELPTTREVDPWVKAIIGLWDDPVWYAKASRRSLAEAERWNPAILEPMYVDFFDAVRVRPGISDLVPQLSPERKRSPP